MKNKHYAMDGLKDKGTQQAAAVKANGYMDSKFVGTTLTKMPAGQSPDADADADNDEDEEPQEQ